MKIGNKHIKDITFVAFDIETTGLDPEYDKILEVAAVKFNTGEILDKFETFVDPGLNVSPGHFFTDVHDITGAMVKGKPKIEEVLPGFFDFLGKDTTPIAHNAEFDVSFIAYSMYKNKIERPGITILDTIRLARRLFPGLPGYSLGAVVSNLRIKTKPIHRALGDCLACRGVFLRCLREIDPELDFTLSELTGVNYKPITFDNCYSTGIITEEQLEYIKTAIEKKEELFLEYTKYHGEVTSRKIRPLEIYISNGKIYLKSYCYLRKEERSFRMDRIARIENVSGRKLA